MVVCQIRRQDESLSLNFLFHLTSMFQVRPKAGEAKFGEWPHVCAVLKTEIIGGVRVSS